MLKQARAAALVFLAAALAVTPGTEAWIFAVLAWWAALWLLADRAASRGGRAELWAAGAMANGIVSVALVVAVTGGATSPFRFWMILPVAGLMTRYSSRAVAIGLALASGALLVAMVAVDPQSARSDPSLVVTPMALIGATAAMCWALMKSETNQRRVPDSGELRRA